MGAGPQVGGAACGGDEGLDRADRQGQQGCFPIGVGGKGAGEGGGQVQVVPDRVIGNAGVGGELLPQGTQLAVVGLFVQLRAEAPEGEQGLAQVFFALFGAQRHEQIREMVEAALLDVVEVGVGEAVQIEVGAGQRVDEHGLVRPAYLCPVGYREGLLLAGPGGDGDFFHWPLRPVGRGGPPVGALYVAVDGFFQPLLEQHVGQGFVVVRINGVALGGGVDGEQPGERPGGSPLVPGRVAQQHEGFLRRVVDARGEFGLPDDVFVLHGLRPWFVSVRIACRGRHALAPIRH